MEGVTVRSPYLWVVVVAVAMFVALYLTGNLVAAIITALVVLVVGSAWQYYRTRP